MFKILTKIFIVFIIFHPGKLTAMLFAYDQDKDETKSSSYHKKFLISEFDSKAIDKTNGVMTLCFKYTKGVWDHCALVFEIMDPKESKIGLSMIHYTGVESWNGKGAQKMPETESAETTLIKVYRSMKKDKETDKKGSHSQAPYIRYASWIVPNAMLDKAYSKATKDKRKHEAGEKPFDSYSCVEYVTRIMKCAGVKVDFLSLWANTPSHLQWLIKRTKDEAGCFGGFVDPAPDRINNYTPIPDPDQSNATT